MLSSERINSISEAVRIITGGSYWMSFGSLYGRHDGFPLSLSGSACARLCIRAYRRTVVGQGTPVFGEFCCFSRQVSVIGHDYIVGNVFEHVRYVEI